HSTVESSRVLMRAHSSPKTWTEQSRRLMELRPKVEDISEDLKMSASLFANQKEIVEGLGGITEYLRRAETEYEECHQDVVGNDQVREHFEKTIKNRNMIWVR